MKLYRQWLRFLLLYKYWALLEKCRKLVDDPKSKFAIRMTENLTIEEMDGVTDLERVCRLMSMPKEELIKDLEHLKKRLEE